QTLTELVVIHDPVRYEQIEDGFGVVVEVAGQAARERNIGLPWAADAAEALALEFPAGFRLPGFVSFGRCAAALDVEEQIIQRWRRRQRDDDGDLAHGRPQSLRIVLSDSCSALFTTSQRSHAMGSIRLSISRSTQSRRSLGSIASSSQHSWP